ncbi:hypothetical protein [Flavobacterium sp.]|uniref:hypothetical protein n=1 Tax=Flavobacterium sp. TaxID=239 RepID=UPI00286A19E3|nr:hypothetical protein [Flavobacterium sp.]
MKGLLKIVSCSIFVLLMSCKKETEMPKVIYENPSKTAVQPKMDTTKIVVADLPVQMQGTNVLLFPVGDLNVAERNSKGGYDSSSAVNKQSFKISNYSENEITGYLRNVKFQQIGTDSIKTLTDKPVLIQSVTYLKTIADKTKQQILVYMLADMDTNKDNALDTNDIQSLYLSDISGTHFTKVSADFQEVIDWNVIESKCRLYFRTIEDANKNGAFDKNDIVHYHFIDLSGKDWKVSDYNLN